MHVVSTHPADRRHTDALREALADIDAPGWAVVFADRHEMAVEALRLHYAGIKLVHVCGGDTPHGTNGHPDHRTRDAISMLAHVHCVSNQAAADNLRRIGVGVWDDSLVAITGAPGLDEVVRFAKTLDPHRKREGVFEWFPETPVGYKPLNDSHPMPQTEFLHRLAHCELFVSNSSAALYEAPILGTPVRLVGERQAGRSQGPYHHPEGKACETIATILREVRCEDC